MDVKPSFSLGDAVGINPAAEKVSDAQAVRFEKGQQETGKYKENY